MEEKKVEGRYIYQSFHKSGNMDTNQKKKDCLKLWCEYIMIQEKKKKITI